MAGKSKIVRTYCVYKHTSPNGKVYIGVTCKIPEHRWQNGNGYKANSHFYRAIKKYGWDNFTHEILFNGLSKEDAYKKEVELIAFYNATNENYGYNISTGGENHFAGYHHSEETKKKIGNANKISQLGKHHSEETKRKMSEAHKGKSAIWLKGKIWSDEQKENLSQALKGKKKRPFSDEHKQHIRDARIGCELSEKTKQKLRERMQIVKTAYSKYKENGGTLKWADFQKEYKNERAC